MYCNCLADVFLFSVKQKNKKKKVDSPSKPVKIATKLVLFLWYFSMNIPNAITLIRVVLIPFFIDLMIYDYYQPALIVFIAACLTDALDGLIARLTNTKTSLGAFLDPVADKLLIVSSFITLAILQLLPIWFVIIVVSRDIILAFGSFVITITGHRLTIRPSVYGKITTVLQLISVVLTLALVAYGMHTGYLKVAYLLSAIMTVVSGVQYVLRGMKLMSSPSSPT